MISRLLLLGPVTAVLLGWLFLGQTLTPLQIGIRQQKPPDCSDTFYEPNHVVLPPPFIERTRMKWKWRELPRVWVSAPVRSMRTARDHSETYSMLAIAWFQNDIEPLVPRRCGRCLRRWTGRPLLGTARTRCADSPVAVRLYFKADKRRLFNGRHTAWWLSLPNAGKVLSPLSSVR